MGRCLCLISMLVVLAHSLAAQNRQSADFEIRGIVVDAVSGAPVADAQVAIAPAADRTAYRTGTTGQDGRFSFRSLSPGKYALFAEADGYSTQLLQQHGQNSTAVAVGPELNSRNLVFPLVPYGSISGRVTNDMNEPVRDAEVALYERTSDPLARMSKRFTVSSTKTNDLGVYHFAFLWPGKYAVAVQTKPWYAQQRETPEMRRTAQSDDLKLQMVEPAPPPEQDGTPPEVIPPTPEDAALDVAYPITYYPDTADPDRAEFISVTPGAKISADISLHAVPAVHARFAVDSAKKLNVSLQQRGLGGTWIPEKSFIGAQRVLEISGIPPGHYSAEVTFETEGNPDGEARTLELDLAGNSEIDASRPAGNVQITGTVRFDSGETPATGHIMFHDRKTDETFGIRISDGKLDCLSGCTPGLYDLSIEDAGIFLLSVTATAAEAIGHTVDIKLPGPAVLSLVLTRATGEVTGIALQDGKPAGGALVLLVPKDPSHNPLLFRRDQSDSDGTFSLKSVVPGTYTLVAIANGWGLDYTNPNVLNPYLAQGTPVQVEAKGKYEIRVKVQ